MGLKYCPAHLVQQHLNFASIGQTQNLILLWLGSAFKSFPWIQFLSLGLDPFPLKLGLFDNSGLSYAFCSQVAQTIIPVKSHLLLFLLFEESAGLLVMGWISVYVFTACLLPRPSWAWLQMHIQTCYPSGLIWTSLSTNCSEHICPWWPSLRLWCWTDCVLSCNKHV